MNRTIFPQLKINNGLRFLVGLSLILVLSGCATGLRIKNLMGVSVVISSLNMLDSIKVKPEFLKFTGSEVNGSRILDRDIRIQGRHDMRPEWIAGETGCLEVSGDATVHILDFNFSGNHGDSTLIRVNSGTLILENCDFKANTAWAIEVEADGILELRNGKFSNFLPGAILMRGGQVRIYGADFEDAGRSPILARGGDLIEIHHAFFKNTVGSAITLNSVSEVWVDSTHISDSFEDGLLISDCDYALLTFVESKENGRHGLSLNDATICGMLSVSAYGNLVSGVSIMDVDTLRILNSEFLGNGEGGGTISNTHRTRMAGVRVGHNGGNGLLLEDGKELLIKNSSFQGNPYYGLVVESLKQIQMDLISLVSNGNGVGITNFDSLSISNSLFSANREKGLFAQSGNISRASNNLFKDNNQGLVFNGVLELALDSNQVEANTLGSDLRSITTLEMMDNLWQHNKSASYFSDMGTIKINRDQWHSNTETALEVMSGRDLLITNARLVNNPTSGLFNTVPVMFESCQIDSSEEVALRIMNGSLGLSKSRMMANHLAVSLSEGSSARITQTSFEGNTANILAQPSVSLSMSFSSMVNSRTGIQLGNYGELELLSNHFGLIDDYCIDARGPHLQSILLRQNVVNMTGGILKSASKSGVINIQSNTFTNNLSAFQMHRQTVKHLDHNIFFETPSFDSAILTDELNYRWNCIYPQLDLSGDVPDGNLYLNPEFDENYYLKPQSPCLNGGADGFLIGALGARPETRPTLQP